MYFSTNCDRFTKKKKYKLNQIHQFSFKQFHRELCCCFFHTKLLLTKRSM